MCPKWTCHRFKVLIEKTDEFKIDGLKTEGSKNSGAKDWRLEEKALDIDEFPK